MFLAELNKNQTFCLLKLAATVFLADSFLAEVSNFVSAFLSRFFNGDSGFFLGEVPNTGVLALLGNIFLADAEAERALGVLINFLEDDLPGLFDLTRGLALTDYFFFNAVTFLSFALF